MTTQNLLVELFVEELPPKALNKLGAAFSNVLAEQLKAQGLAAADAVVTAFASPRRLAAHVTGVLAVAADKPVVQKLMPVAVGLDASGNATPALLKKLSALGGNDVFDKIDGKTDAIKAQVQNMKESSLKSLNDTLVLQQEIEGSLQQAEEMKKKLVASAQAIAKIARLKTRSVHIARVGAPCSLTWLR